MGIIIKSRAGAEELWTNCRSNVDIGALNISQNISGFIQKWEEQEIQRLYSIVDTYVCWCPTI